MYDLRYDLIEGANRMLGYKALGETDLASTPAGSTWTDQAVVDIHAYLGWTYDYLYERFGRGGFDGQNGTIRALTHWPHPNVLTQLPELGRYFCNASWSPTFRTIFIGEPLEGLCNPLAGSFDTIAHELAHGVTSTSSNLIYLDEPGALNEAFSDIIGYSAEYFHLAKGSGLPYATNYQIGEESWTNQLPDRDMQAPASAYGLNLNDGSRLFSLPNHYASRWLRTKPIGEAPDNGWVHINSSIVNHAFYLAIEGGTNARSGKVVRGVGAANRADI